MINVGGKRLRCYARKFIKSMRAKESILCQWGQINESVIPITVLIPNTISLKSIGHFYRLHFLFHTFANTAAYNRLKLARTVTIQFGNCIRMRHVSQFKDEIY